jgi:hypothetical protein
VTGEDIGIGGIAFPTGGDCRRHYEGRRVQEAPTFAAGNRSLGVARYRLDRRSWDLLFQGGETDRPAAPGLDRASLSTPRVPEGVIAQPSAPQFSSRPAVIWGCRWSRPPGGTPILIPTGKRRSAFLVISRGLPAFFPSFIPTTRVQPLRRVRPSARRAKKPLRGGRLMAESLAKVVKPAACPL